MAWDESKHPREPKGSTDGGQFTGAKQGEGESDQAYKDRVGYWDPKRPGVFVLPKGASPTTEKAAQAAREAAGVPLRGPEPLPGQGKSAVFSEGETVRITGNVTGSGQVGRVVQIAPSGSYFGVQDNLGQWLGYFHESDLEPDRGDGEDWDED